MTNFTKMLGLAVLIAGVIYGWRWYNNTNTITAAQKEKPLVALVQVIEHPALDQTRQGILDELKEAGYEDGKTIGWAYESAQGNPALALQITQKFVGQNATIIVALGTTPAQTAVRATQENKTIPVVFSSVTDPIGAKLVANFEKPTDNVTGATNSVDAKECFRVFKGILPHMKILGIVYNPGEANSVSALEQMQAAAGEFNLTLVPISASKTSEVLAAAQGLIGKVDAIFINNDNTALAAFDAIAKVGLENKIPVFVSDVDLLKKGALAALGPDQYELGRQTGRMIIKILQGKKTTDIPVEKPAKVSLKLNIEMANKLGLQFTEDLVSQADREGE